MATKSRENARETAKPDVGQGSVSQEMQATASHGYWRTFATSRGNHLRIPLRNSTFLVRRSSVPERKVAKHATCVKQRGPGPRLVTYGEFES